MEPLIKVLHIPTFEPTFLDAIADPSRLSRGLECLVFAIFYGAVTSMDSQACQDKLGEDRGALIQRYRFAVEQGKSNLYISGYEG